MDVKDGNTTQIDYLSATLPNIIAPILSWISVSILITFCLVKKLVRDTMEKMIMWINFSILIYTSTKVSVLFYPPQNDQYCKVMETISQFGIVSSILWVMSFGHALMMYAKTSNTKVISNGYKYYVGLCLFFSLLVAVLVFTMSKVVSYENGKCVRNIPHNTIEYKFILSRLIPILATLGVCAYCLRKTIVYLRAQAIPIDTGLVFVLIAFPAMCLICWTPTLVMHVFLTFWPEAAGEAFIQTVRSVAMLHGFLNVVTLNRRPLRRFFCRCRKQRADLVNIEETYFGGPQGQQILGTINEVEPATDANSINYYGSPGLRKDSLLYSNYL